jgi:hypothetical protein
LPNWLGYLFYASRAETTTGVSQKELWDSAREAFRNSKGPDDVYGMFGSALAFAVVANLQIYVQESFSKFADNHPVCNGMVGAGSLYGTLLLVLVRMAVRPTIFLPKNLLKSKWSLPKFLAN